MRKLIVGGLTVGAVVVSGGAALAGPPEIQQKSCEADHGVFAKDHGVKTCTTTAMETRTFTATLAPQTFGVRLQGFDLVSVTLTGTAQETADVLVTTVRTQKGNGELTTTSSEELIALSTVVAPRTCHAEGELLGNTVFERDLTDPGVCTHPWDYRLEDLFSL